MNISCINCKHLEVENTQGYPYYFCSNLDYDGIPAQNITGFYCSHFDIRPFVNVNDCISDLDKSQKYLIWHDGGEWIISLKDREMTNCKRLIDWLEGK